MYRKSKTIRKAADVRTLLAILVVVMLLDLATTIYGLNNGYTEQNMFIVGLLEQYGITSLFVLKGVVLLWCYLADRLLGKSYFKAALVGAILPQAVAVILNFSVLL